MYDCFIIASSDEAEREGWGLVCEELRDEVAPDATIEAVGDAASAYDLWADNPGRRTLFLVQPVLKPVSDADPDSVKTERGGAELILRLQKESLAPGCILIGSTDPVLWDRLPPFALVEQVDPCRATEAAFCVQLPPLARKLARNRDARARSGPAAPAPGRRKPEQKWALLEVTVDQTRSSVSLCVGVGDKVQRRWPQQELDLERTELSAIVEQSRKMRADISRRLRADDIDGWEAEYAKLGNRVFNLIWKNDLPYLWGRACEAAEANTRVRFVLGADAYDALWEAALKPGGREWLTNQSTIARRAHVQEANPPVRSLDGNDGTVHMLLIASDVRPTSKLCGPDTAAFHKLRAEIDRKLRLELGRSPRIDDAFPPLPELPNEVEALQKLKQEHELARGTKLHIEVVKRDREKSLADVVRDKLLTPQARRYRYDVVHFAGHALFEDPEPNQRNRGYLLFGNDEERTNAVPISEFASWLKRGDVQLAYLNCCRSSAARAAYELATRNIPLAIGFTWDLDSRKAVQFAQLFYDRLLANDLKVCPAFREAKRELYDKIGFEDPIWTAPVLVAQPTEWNQVETCFLRAEPRAEAMAWT